MGRPTAAVMTQRPTLTKIVGKFQVTVPPEFRELFDLREGDLLEWNFDAPTSEIRLVPKRAQLLTPAVREIVNKARSERSRVAENAVER